MQHYYSIHGSERDGWRLNLYKYTRVREFQKNDDLTNQWLKPKVFDTWAEVLAEIERIETE